jgi:hypothetical protein
MDNTNNTNEIKYIPMYKSYIDAVAQLNNEDRLAIYEAIFTYGFTGVEPTFDNPYLAMGWNLVKPNLVNNINNAIKNQENGKKGGRPKKSNDVVESSKPSTEKEAPQVTISTQPIPEVQVEEKVSEIKDNEVNDSTGIKLQELMITDVRELSEFKSKYNCYIPKVLLEYMYLVEGKLGLENKLKKIYNQIDFNIQLLDILKEQHNKEVSIKELV